MWAWLIPLAIVVLWLYFAPRILPMDKLPKSC
ncbi:hypothetical protein Dde_1005 [Oleidesulfovibrio alaskensis G20]|uniref:Uncharacterized protein n=1 Tax=Oleidesulfovibrio alaskensis (strain ATCC BAA-1058 / DSM 17464 / G20) TaxID=207559 RepID=Q313U0_OLEA2|nr:hypothetical protein Dde_1005 [Oleidesulfovibrio alaskensis G20]